MNVILTKVVVWSVQYIGFSSHSETFTMSSILIFVMTFFNTAILLLLGNADIRAQIPFLGWLLHGKYNDYSTDWFNDIGDILVVSMIINIFIPPAELWFEMFCNFM